MKRREFLATALFAQIATATEEVRITRVVRADIPTKRPKLVGKNSRLGVHGDRSRDSVVRLFTNTGVEGFGDCRMNKQAAKQLLGKRPLEFFQFSANRFVGPFGVGTMPLWDLLGQAGGAAGACAAGRCGAGTGGGVRWLDLFCRPAAAICWQMA